MGDDKAEALWQAIVTKVKEAELDPPLWRAMDAAVPICLEGGTLVIGFAPKDEPQMTFFGSAQAAPRLHQVLGTVATKPVELRAIDGTTPEDYQRWQAREAAREAVLSRHADEPPSDSPFDPRPEGIPAATGSAKYVHDLMLDFRHRHTRLPSRNSSYSKASFLHEIMPDMLQAEADLRTIEQTAEGFVRAASRMIDKVAEMLSIEPMIVAMEFKRYRREHHD